MSEETETETVALARIETAAPIVARNFDEARAMSAELSKSTSVLPLSLRSAPDVLAIVMTGSELGLPPMAALRSLYVLDGKPSMYVAAKLAVVRARGCMDVFREIESTPERATYEIGRRGEAPIRRTFTIDDAKGAQLVKSGGNYVKSPAKMLRWRVIGELLDLIFPDVLLGIGDETGGDVGPEPVFAAPPAAAAAVAVAVADAGAAAKAERKKTKKDEAAPAPAPASEPAPSPSGASGKAAPAGAAAPSEQPSLSLVPPPSEPPKPAPAPAPPAAPISPPPSTSNADDGFGDVSEDERTAAAMADALAAVKTSAELQAVRQRFSEWSKTENAKPYLQALKEAYAARKAAIEAAK
jgi:hypothetical protein